MSAQIPESEYQIKFRGEPLGYAPYPTTIVINWRRLADLGNRYLASVKTCDSLYADIDSIRTYYSEYVRQRTISDSIQQRRLDLCQKDNAIFSRTILMQREYSLTIQDSLTKIYNQNLTELINLHGKEINACKGREKRWMLRCLLGVAGGLGVGILTGVIITH